MRKEAKKAKTSLEKMLKWAKRLTIVFGVYTLVALIMAFFNKPLPFADASAIIFSLAAVVWAFVHDELQAETPKNKNE